MLNDRTKGVIDMISSYFNEWLDEYNDYRRLYMLFGDDQYLEQAEESLNTLKSMVLRAERYKSIVWKIMSDSVHAYGEATGCDR